MGHTEKKYKDGWYSGETQFLTGKRHGHGTFRYTTGVVYEGEWKNDKMHGQGTIYCTDGRILKGLWENGCLNGWSEVFYPDGSVSDALWEKDELISERLRENTREQRLANLGYGDGTLLSAEDEYELLHGVKYDAPDAGNTSGAKAQATKRATHVGGASEEKMTDNDFELMKKVLSFTRASLNSSGSEEDRRIICDGLSDPAVMSKFCELAEAFNREYEATSTEPPEKIKTASASKSNEQAKKSTAGSAQTTKTQSPAYGTKRYHNGDVYEGELLDRWMHGKGTYRWMSGSVYEGEWQSGKRCGHGVMKYIDGNSYDGEWKQDTMHGRGVLCYKNGDVFDGEWQSGKRCGRGVMKYKNGNAYDGDWKDDKIHGHGVYRWCDGVVYEGEWSDGKRSGHGRIKHPNGNFYDGEWKQDKMHGHGTYRYAHGDTFEGEHMHGKRCGRGTYKYANGAVYEGVWTDDRNAGSGTYKIGTNVKYGNIINGSFCEC